jgi:hypothetical protein
VNYVYVLSMCPWLSATTDAESRGIKLLPLTEQSVASNTDQTRIDYLMNETSICNSGFIDSIPANLDNIIIAPTLI